jgi:aminopeptidase N
VTVLHCLILPIALPVCAQVPAQAASPFSFDSAYGRLPKNVVPLDYAITLTPDVAAHSLSGKESVIVQVRQATATMVLNSLDLTLHEVRVDGKTVAGVASDNEKQLTTITLKEPIAAGRHVLSMTYVGKLQNDPRGMFAQPYIKPDGSKATLVSTKFESTEARRVFPCWDEPAFRTTFRLTTIIPAAWTAVSNMPVAQSLTKGKVATVTFLRSPKMPTYLVELSAGDLAEISAQSGTVKLGIWAVRGQEHDGQAALVNASQILADYNDYFGVSFPLPKLDSIAIPGGYAGAMENWGAITYNDQILLLTAASTLRDRQSAFAIQAHEMAHQWNGDLVTMGWWDDIWLNESFASWRAAKETDARHPEWKWWELQDDDKEGAMTADARLTSHAIQQHVSDELQVTNAFDPAITYFKGQAVLRMLEAYLGPDTFRDGIRRFMKAHAYSNATSADLWAALSTTSQRDVGKIAASWIEQSGFPLVSAAASCDASGQRTLALSQRRFLLRGHDSKAAQWQVPLQVRSTAQGRPQSVLLTRQGQTISAGRCDQPLSINADTVGFYRAAYDDATLRTNTKAFGSLLDADRIALLDDQWALAEAGQQPLSSYLALAGAMGPDFDEEAWTQIDFVLAKIERDERGTPGHDAYAAFARTVLEPVADHLEWDARTDESPGDQKLRRIILGDLGAWGDADIVAEARKRFAAFVVDRRTIAPDNQALILTIVARNSDEATFEQLHVIAKTAASEAERLRYYRALMQVRDPSLAARAAKIALSSEIPPQADAERIWLVARLVDDNPQLAWSTLTENVDRLMLPQGRYAPLTVAQDIPDIYWSAVPLDQLEHWVRAHVPAEMADSVARGMEDAHFQFDEKKLLVEAADRYVDARAAGR